MLSPLRVAKSTSSDLSLLPSMLSDAALTGPETVDGVTVYRGAGADLALMLIESNHDLRATRILVGRLNDKVQRLEAVRDDRAAPPGGPAIP